MFRSQGNPTHGFFLDDPGSSIDGSWAVDHLELGKKGPLNYGETK
jgi:hypothetical protein